MKSQKLPITFQFYQVGALDRSCRYIFLVLFSVTNNLFAVAHKFSRPRLAVCVATQTSLRLTKTTVHATQVACSQSYFDSLSGLWFGQSLSEHRSGMVLVPSIIRDPQVGQSLPLGLALIAYLHFG